MAAHPLLVTKVHIPSVGKTLVNRERLFQQLEQCLSLQNRLVILSAPAGYGKTTLVSSWVRQKASAMLTVWISLDAGDNDPVRFWLYLVSAIRAKHQVIENETGWEADLPARLTDHSFDETFLVMLLNELAQINEEIIIVLDDYHLIQETSIHKNLWFLIERLPERVHLLILTRSDPPFPLARLRGQGQVFEIRQEDLCFQDDEAAVLLIDRLGLPLTADEVRLLNLKAEGWASGLQLAAISMRGQKDPLKLIHSFSGANRFILDYLVSEVLQNQAPEVRQFLLYTSILEILTASLCTFVIASAAENQLGAPFTAEQSQAMLEYLERSNLFVIPLAEDRSAFRYHHLFADLLQKQLKQLYPHLWEPLHQQASRWFEQHESYEWAIDHAIAGQDYLRASKLLSKNALTLWRAGEYTTLNRLLKAIPGAYKDATPQLYLTQALLLYSNGHVREAQVLLEKVEGRAAQGDLEPDVLHVLRRNGTILRTMIAMYQGDVDTALSNLSVLNGYLANDRTFWLSDYAITQGMVSLVQGEVVAASQQLLAAIQSGKETGAPNSLLIAAPTLIWLYGKLGKTQRAQALLKQTLDDLKTFHFNELPIFNGIYIVQAGLLAQQGEVDRAESVLRYALERCLLQHDIPNVVSAYIGLAQCQAARQAWTAAEDFLQQVAAILQDHQIPVWKESEYAGLLAWVYIRQHQLAFAEALLRERGFTVEGTISFLRQNEYVSLALLLIMQGRFVEAGRVLDGLEALIEQTEQLGVWLSLHLLRAFWWARQGNEPQALHRLNAALDCSTAYAHFLEWSAIDPQLLSLLQRLLLERTVPDPVRRCLAFATAQQPEGQPSAQAELVESLSRREIEVLRLVAEGLSNKEIAQRLHVTLQTVKFHTNQIFAKFGVCSRTQAVAKAQTLGML